MIPQDPIISARSRYWCGHADPSILAAAQSTVVNKMELFSALSSRDERENDLNYEFHNGLHSVYKPKNFSDRY